MIARAAAFVLILYALGFALFAVTLPDPAAGVRTDAIVVPTGGKGRIERGVAVLAAGGARRLLVSGADPSVTKADLKRRLKGQGKLVACCVELESVSVDTRSNAEEARRWARKHKVRSVRLVTNDWHMRRARYEFERAFGKEVEIVPDAVRTEPGLRTLFAEYSKYVLRRLSVWFDL